MKKRVGVWVDSVKAVIISFNEQKHPVDVLNFQPRKRVNKSPKLTDEVRNVLLSPIETKLRIPGDAKEFSRHGNQHYSTELKNVHKLRNEKNQYFRKILQWIKDVDEVVLFGPSLIKRELESKMQRESLSHVHLKAVKTADYMSDKQMVRWVENYFRTTDHSKKH